MTVTDAGTRRTRNIWIGILVGALVVIGVSVVAVAAGGWFLFRQNVRTATVSAQDANDQFERAAARFAGQQPLFEFDGDDVVMRRPDASPASRHQIAALHVLAYDTDDGRLVNLTVPRWLLRFIGRGDGRVTVNGVDVLRPGGKRITLDDLERHGPGLVLASAADSPRDRVLIWTE
jgi:hypothetical protein